MKKCKETEEDNRRKQAKINELMEVCSEVESDSKRHEAVFVEN